MSQWLQTSQWTSSCLFVTVSWIQIEVLYFSASATVNNDSFVYCSLFCDFQKTGATQQGTDLAFIWLLQLNKVDDL